MTDKLRKTLLQKISNIPGLVGFSPIDFSLKKRMLPEKDLAKGISFEDTPKGLLIRIAIFIDVDIRAKLVIKEINSSVKTIFKNNTTKFNKISIYVMGVK